MPFIVLIKNRLRGAANVALDVGRMSGLDVLGFRTIFDNIYHVIDAWREISATDTMSVFISEIKEQMAMVEKRLEEMPIEEIEQLGFVAQVKDAINKKKAKITETIEEIFAL